MGRSAPRPASAALRSALEHAAPRTPLAGAQIAWAAAVGDAIAAASEPVAERGGTLTISCESAAWAQELSLMESELLERLRGSLGEASPSALRFLAG